MGKNRKQVMALILSGLVAFNGSFTVNATEVSEVQGQNVVADTATANAATEKTVSFADWDLNKLTKWGTELVLNEDGTVTVQFTGQYSQVFLPIPADIDPAKIEKVIVGVDSNEHLSLKLCDLNNLAGDVSAVVYGSNEIGASNLVSGAKMSNVNCLGIMNLNEVEEDTVYEKTFSTITFVINENATSEETDESEESGSTVDTQENEKTYKISDMKVSANWGATVTENEDGSETITFPGQYKQISYAIPEDVDVTRLEQVIVNTDDKSSLSVKLMADLEIQDEAAVVYGNNTISIDSLKDGYSASDLKAVVLMSLLDGEYAPTITSITFKMSAAKPAPVQDRTYKISELTQAAHWNVEITENEDGTSKFFFEKQYGASSYLIPEEVDMNQVDALVCNVKGSASALSLKFFTDTQMQEEKAVIYGGNTISIDKLDASVKPADVKSFGIMGLEEECEIVIESITFKMKQQQESDGQQFNTYFKDATYNNPIVTQRYSADPSVMVYDGTVYVYSTNDIYEYDRDGNVVTNTYAKIKTINCFSSTDMVNWTDHGAIPVAGKGNDEGAAKWANNSWAPCAAHKTIDGKEKFFLYFADNGSGIGVLTSDSPTGPWEDPLGTQLISRQTPTCANITWLFDPAVMVDDDGTGYLCFGGGVPEGKESHPQNARIVKLGDDMISLASDPVMIDAPWLFEDSGINKIGDTYYYTYCTNWSGGPYGNANIAYMTSKDPMGPYEFQGIFFSNPGKFFGDWGNNHHSLFEFNGKYYLAYHARNVDKEILGATKDYRSTQIDEVTIDADGKLQDVTATMEGVSQLSSVNPYVVNEAECMAREYGISVQGVGNTCVEADEGDWIGVKSVDFEYGVSNFTVKAAALEAATIEIRTGNPTDGTLVGKVEVENTNGEYVEYTVPTLNVSGERNLFFCFKGHVMMDSWQAHAANLFTFDQLEKVSSYNLTETLNGDGSLSVDYDKQWAEIRYEIPSSVDVSKLTKVTVLTEDGNVSKLSVKLLNSIDSVEVAAVAYGSNTLEVPVGTAENANYIGIMNMLDGEASYKFSAVVFDVETVKDKGEAGTEVQMDIPDLEDAVAAQTDENFITGVSITGNEISDKKLMAVVTKHFNAVTLGNELKPDANFGYASKCPTKQTVELNGEEMEVPTLDFSRAERMLNAILEWNEANPDNIIKVRGHVLVWHSQTPEWFFHEDYDANKPYVSPEEMTKREEWYIKSVLEHYLSDDSKYKDLFYGWDVVNEAVSDGRGTYRNDSENSSWWAVYHSNEFIINAFRFANKYAPANVELYYNDYNEWVSSKVDGIVQLLTDVKNAEGTRIDGMGMQGHYSTAGSPSIAEFKSAATRYAEVVGQVQLTELDLSASNAYDGTKKTEAAEFTRQAYRYADIFNAVKDLRESGIDFRAITIWGVIDKNSWLQTSNSVGGAQDGTRKQCPLLFDNNYQVKPAYWAFVDPTQLEPEIKTLDIVGIRDIDTLGTVCDSSYVEMNGSSISAKVYTTWTKEWINAEFKVEDSTVDAKDAVIMYVSYNGKKSSFICERSVGTETENGYMASVALRYDDFDVDSFNVGDEIKIDFVVVNGNKKVAYNDYTFSQDRDDQYFAKATLKPYMEIQNGTAAVDGQMDEIWNTVKPVPLTINLGSKVSAEARILWDTKNLYTYIVVTDPVLNADSANAHEKDSVEIFIDENNHKSDSYEEDDKQYRVNYLNEQTFNGTKCVADNIQSEVVLTDTGYVLETAIAWTDITPENGQQIGLELQINDADKSGKRIGTLSWYDTTGQGWSKPGVFGTATLVGEEIVIPTEIQTELGTWVSGSYSQNKATIEENEKRIRLTEKLDVVAGNTYEATVTDPAFRIIVRQVLNGKVSTFYLNNKDRFTAVEGAEYYLAIHNVYNNYKDLTFDTYVALFENGFSAGLTDVTETVKKEATEFTVTLSTGQESKWVSGTYAISTAKEEANKLRIRLADALEVIPGETYGAYIEINGKQTQSFRYIIRKVDENNKVSTFFLSAGETFVAEEGATYYVSTQNYWSNYKDLDFQKYEELMFGESQLVFDIYQVK